MIQIKRVYEPPKSGDGYRVLVDRLWPRGLSKKELAIDEWLKSIAPSNELRKFFGHDPLRWNEFRSRFKRELKTKENEETLHRLVQIAKKRKLTLFYAARDERRNNAVVLRDILNALAFRGK